MSECSCKKCVSCCERNPGWFTPEEAQQAIAAGLSNRLMLDWLEPCSQVGNDEQIFILAPASIGYEGFLAPTGDDDLAGMILGTWCKGRCTFLKDQLCEIHTSGFKPVQCRESKGCSSAHDGPSNYDVAKLWDTEEGHAAVAAWKAAVKF